MEIDLIKDDGVKNTKILINSLRKKIKEFNDVNLISISFTQAKTVFIYGATNSSNLKPLISGFVYLNRFLESLNLNILTSYSKQSKISELEISIALEDLNKFGIIFDINNIDELYLTDESINLLDNYV